MRSGSGAASAGGFDAAAVVGGLLAGLVTVVLAAVVLGMVKQQYSVSGRVDVWLTLVVRSLGFVVSGVWAGRRAGSGGLVHGAAAALLTLSAAFIVYLISFDSWHVWLQLGRDAVLAMALGGIGGILGVNRSR